jgi:uncharacterized protein YggE
MGGREVEVILAAISDLQVAVDAMGLDVQRVIEIISATDSPQPPPWVNPAGHRAAEDAAGEAEVLYPSVAYPPPARGRGGRVEA